jgi:hypothetical protein
MEYVTGDAATLDASEEDKGEKLNLVDSVKLAKQWATELAASKKWMSKFVERARKCERAYIDEQDATTRAGSGGSVNLFWSNVQVTLAAIYGRLPKATVDRKYRDYQDDVARVAAEMMQRILNGDIDRESDDTNPAMRDAVQDRFVSGLGQVWCRYDVTTETYEAPSIDPATGLQSTEPAERILDEEAMTDYVYWEDFRYSPCRRWRDCRWVARRVYMSKAKLRERFSLSDEQLANVPMTSRSPVQSGDGSDDVLKATPYAQAAVWEIWDKESNKVCWYAEGCTFVLDYLDDILQLEEFFPCPQPVVATTLTKSFLPKPDYVMAQDLYRELDRINAKLAKLESAVKAAGVYDKNASNVKRLMNEGADNELIPVENWSAFVERGGLKGVVDWMPIDATVNAITQLTQRKAQLQHDLYELLGISDIMRGATAASETATAQQLKVQYGGARLASLQNDVARFVAQVMRIRANIIAVHFQPETLIKRSLIDKTPDAQLAGPAIQLLKSNGLAQHSISVDADSMAAPDWEKEKEVRSGLMGAISNYIMAAGPMVAQSPELGIVLLKVMQWAMAGFKGASSIESVIDQAVKQFEQKLMQPPAPPQPTPEDKKHEAEAKKDTATARKTSAEAESQEQTNAMVNAIIKPGGPQPAGPQPNIPGGAQALPMMPFPPTNQGPMQ